MVLTEARKAYLDKLRRNERPASTIDTYDKTLRWFISEVGNKEAASLNFDDIERFDQSMFDRNLVAKTRRNRLAVVRGFVRFLYTRDICELKPEKVELPKVKAMEANFLTKDEAQRLVSVVKDVRDRAMVLCMLTSWVRIEELLCMQLDDLYKRSIVIRNGKGGKPRVVFINYETERAIKRYIKVERGDEPGTLFRSKRSIERIGRRGFTNRLKRYATEAGIKKNIANHTLRHTGATGFLEDGGQVEVAQQILGHANISTTRIYLHFTNDFAKKAYQKTTPSFRYTATKAKKRRKTAVKTSVLT